MDGEEHNETKVGGRKGSDTLIEVSEGGGGGGEGGGFERNRWRKTYFRKRGGYEHDKSRMGREEEK